MSGDGGARLTSPLEGEVESRLRRDRERGTALGVSRVGDTASYPAPPPLPSRICDALAAPQARPLSLKGRGNARAGLAALVTGAVLLTNGASAQSKGDRAFGEYLASGCVACHQRTGQYAGIPPIVGWPDESFIEVMNEYRHKKRDNAVMQTIAGRLSDEEIAALAAYFGSLTLQPTAQ